MTKTKPEHVKANQKKTNNMELLFIWIDEYKNIFNQNFCFSPKYRFHIEKNNISNKLILKLSVNENCLTNQFYKVNNVTAIIGQNGSGKSSILTSLLENQFQIAIYINQTKRKKTLYIICDNNNELVYDDSVKKHFKENEIKKDNYLQKENYKTIYYSNIFNGFAPLLNHPTKFAHPNSDIYNITTDFLLSVNERDTDYYNNARRQEASAIEKFYLQEITRQLFLISNIKTLNKRIKLPKILTIKFNHSLIENSQNQFFINNSILSEKNINEGLEKLRNIAYSSSYNKKNIFIFFLLFYYVVQRIIKYTYPDRHSPHKTQWSDVLKDLIKNSENLLSSKNFLTEIINILEYGANAHKNNQHIIKAIKDINSHILSNLQFDNYSYSFNIENALSFIKLYKKLLVGKSYLLFEWRSMSSGERALLNLFSRFTLENIFLDEYEQQNKPVFENQNINFLILIDEGETLFHPEWQRRYFNDLITFIPRILSNLKTKNGFYIKPKIQLIITSNSPFIASDLPAENIIFLNKEKDSKGEFKCISKKINQLTFGANINNLLANSFFLEDGLIGEFATIKINKIIKNLKGKKNLEKEKGNIKNTIVKIGEPVIKTKLSALYEQTYGEPINIEKEIELLKLKLEILEKKKNDKNK